MPVEFGNAGDVDTAGTGWFIGFSEWTRASSTSPAPALRHVPAGAASNGLCVKWFDHPAGHPNGEAKPVSEGRTVSMLVSAASEFRVEFCADPSFDEGATQSYTLRRHGDFVIWGSGVFHRSFGVKPACILTIRWQE